MTNQEIASVVLHFWQRDRSMPESAIDALLAEAHLSPRVTPEEAEITQRVVSEQMGVVL